MIYIKNIFQRLLADYLPTSIDKFLHTGIFGFFFLRASIALFSFAFILILILLPFYQKQLFAMEHNQGRNFANTTIAANTSHLFKNEFGDVLEYIFTVLKKTPDILFVVISKSSGEEIVINKDSWKLSDNQFHFNKAVMPEQSSVLIYSDQNPVTHIRCFLLHENIIIGGVKWGTLTVGMSDSHYRSIIKRYTLTVIITCILLVLGLLLLFLRNAKNIRSQIAVLSSTAGLLRDGQLWARAPEGAIGEIGALSSAINMMAANLQEKTQHILQLAQVVEQTNDAFIILDAALNISYINQATEYLTGYAKHQLENKPFSHACKMLDIDHRLIPKKSTVAEQMQVKIPSQDLTITHYFGHKIVTEFRFEKIIGTNENTFLIVLADITQRKNLEMELHQIAFYDKLTGLANRHRFIDEIPKIINKAQRDQKHFALLFLDLDNFKYVNDSLGHDAGDSLLIAVATRLKSILRAEDLICRLGGDEFTILLDRLPANNAHIISNIAQKILTCIAAPILIHGKPMYVGVSIGIAQYPTDSTNPEDLIKNADTAMYYAKNDGRGRYAFFSQEMQVSINRHLEIENELAEAIQSHQIFLTYQPIIDLKTSRLVGAEALVRWQHPSKGVIPPNEFIPVAEQSNLMVLLGDHITKLAISQVSAWSSQGFNAFMSINVSTIQFNEPDFIKKLVALCKQHGIAPQNIELEFTESIMLDEKYQAIDKFKQLKAFGFKLAIDDFGTGYSSLSYLKRLPIDVVKIDRSFVSEITPYRKNNAIITAIIALCNDLDIKTVAEGIEESNQAEILASYRCTFGQGYWFDRPLATADFEKKYLNHPGKKIST